MCVREKWLKLLIETVELTRKKFSNLSNMSGRWKKIIDDFTCPLVLGRLPLLYLLNATTSVPSQFLPISMKPSGSCRRESKPNVIGTIIYKKREEMGQIWTSYLREREKNWNPSQTEEFNSIWANNYSQSVVLKLFEVRIKIKDQWTYGFMIFSGLWIRKATDTKATWTLVYALKWVLKTLYAIWPFLTLTGMNIFWCIKLIIFGIWLTSFLMETNLFCTQF